MAFRQLYRLVLAGAVLIGGGACSDPDVRIHFEVDSAPHIIERGDVDDAVIVEKPASPPVVRVTLEPDAREELNAFLRAHAGGTLNVRYKDIDIIQEARLVEGFNMSALYIPVESEQKAEAIRDAFTAWF